MFKVSLRKVARRQDGAEATADTATAARHGGGPGGAVEASLCSVSSVSECSESCLSVSESDFG
jgi:hypothetical protein